MITISIENEHLEEVRDLPGNVSLISYPPSEKADVIVTSENNEFDATLTLKPKEYVIGVGCRRGKEADKLEAFIKRNLDNIGIEVNQIFAIASIDVKKDEKGMLAWSKRNNIPFLTYSEEELRQVTGDFRESDFVRSKVGVGNVCERAAVKAARETGKLICRKIAEDGMTIAIAKREWSVNFNET